MGQKPAERGKRFYFAVKDGEIELVLKGLVIN